MLLFTLLLSFVFVNIYFFASNLRKLLHYSKMCSNTKKYINKYTVISSSVPNPNPDP